MDPENTGQDRFTDAAEIESVTWTGIQSTTGIGMQSTTWTGIQSTTGIGMQSTTWTGMHSTILAGVEAASGRESIIQSTPFTGIHSTTWTRMESTFIGVESTAASGMESLSSLLQTPRPYLIKDGIQYSYLPRQEMPMDLSLPHARSGDSSEAMPQVPSYAMQEDSPHSILDHHPEVMQELSSHAMPQVLPQTVPENPLHSFSAFPSHSHTMLGVPPAHIIPGFPLHSLAGIYPQSVPGFPPGTMPAVYSHEPLTKFAEGTFPAMPHSFHNYTKENATSYVVDGIEDVSEAGSDENQTQANFTKLNEQDEEELRPVDLSKSNRLDNKEDEAQEKLHEVNKPDATEHQTQEKVKVTLKKRELYTKIHFLMHAYGDIGYPVIETSMLMLKLLKSQMLLLLDYLEAIARLRDTETINHEVVLFAMRKNKALLKRLLQFLYVKDRGGHFLPGFLEFRGSKIVPEEAKTAHECFKYLSTLHTFSGDMNEFFCNKIFDHVVEKRLERRFLLQNARSIIQQEFFKFALKVSLDTYAQSLQRYTDFLLTPIATSIIEFLAIETIAGLMEKAVYLRARKAKDIKYQVYTPFDFHCSSEESDDDDDVLNDDVAADYTYSLDKQFSYTPKAYMKDNDPFKNCESKMFYKDSVLAALRTVVLFPSDSKPKYLPSDFTEPHGCDLLNILIKKDSEMQLFPSNGITPKELRAAYRDYQRPDPVVALMKPKHTFRLEKKPKLIALSLFHEEFEEEV